MIETSATGIPPMSTHSSLRVTVPFLLTLLATVVAPLATLALRVKYRTFVAVSITLTPPLRLPFSERQTVQPEHQAGPIQLPVALCLSPLYNLLDPISADHWIMRFVAGLNIFRARRSRPCFDEPSVDEGRGRQQFTQKLFQDGGRRLSEIYSLPRLRLGLWLPIQSKNSGRQLENTEPVFVPLRIVGEVRRIPRDQARYRVDRIYDAAEEGSVAQISSNR